MSELIKGMPPDVYDFSQPCGVMLHYPDRVAVGYSLTGEFVDRTRWIDDGLVRGDLLIIGHAIREAGVPLTADEAHHFIRACDTGLRDPIWRDPQWQAQALRLKAECFDRSGRLAHGLDFYQQALTANPNVRVKRRAQQIEKGLKDKTD